MAYFCINAMMALDCIVQVHLFSQQDTCAILELILLMQTFYINLTRNEGFPGDSAVKYLPAMGDMG